MRQQLHTPANLSSNRALGIRLYGDASGALVNVQIEDETGKFTRDHYVTIDWRGWKTIELGVPETRGLFHHAGGRFPTPLSPKYAMRSFDWVRTLGVNIYVTAATAATLYVSKVEALHETATTFGGHAQVTIGATTLHLPEGLRARPCQDDVSNVTGCADYIECSDVGDASTCKAYNANNFELHVKQPHSTATTRLASAAAIPVTFSSTTRARAEIAVVEESASKTGPFTANV